MGERIDQQAAAQVAADEERIRTRRTPSLGESWRAFWRHPSPWLIGTALLGSVVARSLVHRFSWTELLPPAAVVALFPVIEWVVHVCVLHWRPRHLGPVTVDPLLARKHRAHHADPRDVPLVFVPWPVECWLLPAYAVVAVLLVPDLAHGLTLLVAVNALMLGYEWTHYLVHSDYKPRSAAYRSVWRNHRLHHYKNEHYWFTVTTAGTADRVFGTYPDAAAVLRSDTARALHGGPG